MPRRNLVYDTPLGIFIRSADPYWYYRNLRISGKIGSAFSLLGTFKPQKPKESELETKGYAVYDGRSFEIKPQEPSYGAKPLELEEVITGSKDLLEGMFSNLKEVLSVLSFKV